MTIQGHTGLLLESLGTIQGHTGLLRESLEQYRAILNYFVSHWDNTGHIGLLRESLGQYGPYWTTS